MVVLGTMIAVEFLGVLLEFKESKGSQTKRS